VTAAQLELGRVAHHQGDAARAVALLAELLLPFQKVGNKWGLSYVFAELAAIAAERGRSEQAARLFGAAEGLRESIGHPLPPILRAEYDSAVATARAQLDDTEFAAVWAEREAMSLDQAIAYALNEDNSPTERAA
jgi:hypothetical protein